MSAEQFGALWYSPANDRMPFPFRYRSGFATLDEFENYRHTLQASVKGTEHEHLRRAMSLLSNPDTRIEVFGIAGGTEIRLIGCTDADTAVVATQNPGDNAVRLAMCRPQDLSASIAGLIPVGPAGTVSAQTFYRSDLDERMEPFMQAPDAVTPRRRLARVTTTPDSGTIHICDGPRLGNANTRRIRWHDVADDGCYLETHTATTISVAPGGRTDIRARLDAELRRMQPDPDRRGR